MEDKNTTYINDIPVIFDLEAVSRRLHIREGQTKILNRLAALAEEAKLVARPRGAIKLCGLTFLENDRVRVESVVFTSPLLHKNMGELGRAFAYLVTEGTEMADWCLSLPSAADKIFANALRVVAVKLAEAAAEKEVLEKYGITQVSAMNPGSLATWPIEEQKPFFTLMSPIPENLGVNLLPSLMMNPEFTISGLFFQTETKYFNCQLCPREECPNRKVPSTVI